MVQLQPLSLAAPIGSLPCHGFSIHESPFRAGDGNDRAFPGLECSTGKAAGKTSAAERAAAGNAIGRCRSSGGTRPNWKLSR